MRFLTNMSDKKTQTIKKHFPEGTIIVLDKMADDPRPIAPGTRGVVTHVDDIGTIHCQFGDGRLLGVIPGVDQFHKVSL